MRTIELGVLGMRCRRCVRELTARLRDVAGVETVMVDRGNVVVRLAGAMTVGDVLRACRGLPYKVEILGDSGDLTDS
jgi:copper chaperone CopZ